MFKRIVITILAFIYLLSASVLYAQYKSIKAIGEAEAKNETPEISERKKAREDGRKKALDKYIASLDSQKIKILNNLKEELYKDIDVYVPEILKLKKGHWSDGYWRIDIEVLIDEAQIEKLINKHIQDNGQKKEEG